MWAAITRNSSSPQCQHFPLGALTNLWALEGGGGVGVKGGVPRASLLRFNKCHCGALCQLHKQAAISLPCIFCPFMVYVWEAGRQFSFQSFIYAGEVNWVCWWVRGGFNRLPPIRCSISVVVDEYCSFTFFTHISRNTWELSWDHKLTSLGFYRFSSEIYDYMCRKA